MPEMPQFAYSIQTTTQLLEGCKTVNDKVSEKPEIISCTKSNPESKSGKVLTTAI